MKRFAAVFLTLTILLAPAASAVNTTKSFDYAITVDGGRVAAAVAVGTTVTVSVTLTRTDSPEDFAMRTMQSNVLFNTEYFELVEGSISFTAPSNIEEIRHSISQSQYGVWAGWSEIITGMFSLKTEGLDWPNTKEVATFDLKAIKIGNTEIVSRTYLVATLGGNEYECTSNNVAVSIKDPKDLLPPETGTGGIGGGGGGGAGGEEGGESEGEEPGESEEPESSTDSPSAAIKDIDEFADIPQDAWYKEAVSFVLERGLFQGTSETTFSPETTMTRGMFVTVLSRLAGVTADNSKTGGFSDIEQGMWYSGAVAWAAENDIVAGKGGGIFDPSGEITREQMAQILFNYAKFAGKETKSEDTEAFEAFPDSSYTSDWAKQAVIWASSARIISGTDAGLKPLENASRAQVAQIVFNYCSLI